MNRIPGGEAQRLSLGPQFAVSTTVKRLGLRRRLPGKGWPTNCQELLALPLIMAAQPRPQPPPAPLLPEDAPPLETAVPGPTGSPGGRA